MLASRNFVKDLLAKVLKPINDRLKTSVNDDSVPFIFDYKDGKYGYNTSEERGADTFHPFSSGGTAYKIKMGGVYYALGKYWNTGTGALTTYSNWNAYTLGIPNGATKVHIDNWVDDGYNTCNWFATQVSSGNGYSNMGTLSQGSNTINIPSNVSYVRLSSTASIMNNVDVWFE